MELGQVETGDGFGMLGSCALGLRRELVHGAGGLGKLAGLGLLENHVHNFGKAGLCGRFGRGCGQMFIEALRVLGRWVRGTEALGQDVQRFFRGLWSFWQL